MKQSPQNKRLAEAVAALAATITEIIDERLRDQAIAQRKPKIIRPNPDPFVTKQEVANRMRVSLGTVSAWMRKGNMTEMQPAHPTLEPLLPPNTNHYLQPPSRLPAQPAAFHLHQADRARPQQFAERDLTIRPSCLTTPTMAAPLSVPVKSIKFSCQKCGQHIEAPVAGEGLEVDCPGCKGRVRIPKHGEAKLRANCPRCGQKLKVPAESAGTQIECPVCKHEFEIPVPEPAKPSLPLPRVPRPPGWLVAAALLVVVGGVLAGYWAWTRTPAYSVGQIRHAIDQHDFATFQKYVDIDSVTSRLIDDMVVAGILNRSGEYDSAAAAGAGLVELMKPRLVDEAKKQLSRFIEEGRFGDTNAVAGPFQEWKSSETYYGIVSSKRDGKIAVLGLGFTNTTDAVSHTLELKLRNMGGYWQLAELSNFAELAKKQEAEAKERQARRNAPIISKIKGFLQVVELRKISASDQFGIDKHVEIRMRVKNTGAVGVLGYTAVIKPNRPGGTSVKEVRLRSDDVISAGDTGSGSWEIDVNQFDASDMALYDAAVSAADVQFVRVRLDGRPELVVEE